MSSEDNKLNPVVVSNVSLLISPQTPYDLLDGASHRLVNVDMVTTMTDVNPLCQNLTVAPSLLPFGLLESVTASSTDVCDVQYCILLSKETGQRQSAWVPLNTPIHMCNHTVAVDDDARHADIAAAKAATKHDMRFRMIAGAGIANIQILFQGLLPSTLLVTYHGANAIPRDLELGEANLASIERRKVPMLLPALSPKARMNGAVRKMHETSAK